MDRKERFVIDFVMLVRMEAVVRHLAAVLCLCVLFTASGGCNGTARDARPDASASAPELTVGSAGLVVVAPADASDAVKRRADLVCDGVDDQEELSASFKCARRDTFLFDTSPIAQAEAEAYVRHSVVWLPGTYNLGDTLVIPDAADCVINAQGAYLQYNQPEGDAVRIEGAYRCRYNFGTIDSHSVDAAIRIRPHKQLYTGMSFITFTGLIGHDFTGTGLLLDATESNICVNKFEGTDIRGFDRGVFVSNAPSHGANAGVPGKVDTNWFWFVYIRECMTGVQESTQGVDSGVWNVNVDATRPDAVALRIGGGLGRWFVHMGVWGGGKAIIIEPGATYLTIEMPLPLRGPYYENNSGNDTNTFIIGGKTMTSLPTE
jgi:hypothetical protein